MHLTDGNPAGDTYAISLNVPSTYFPGTEVERTVYRNVHGTSATEALAAVPAEQRDRVASIWPERF